MKLDRTGAALAGALALGLAGAAWAFEVEARSTSFVGASPAVVERQLRTVVPITELVGVSVRDITTPITDELFVSIDGWAAAELGGERVLGGDLGVAFVEGKFLSKRLRARLGRQFVVGGTARAFFVDGLLVEGKLPRGFAVTAFAGQPVARAFSNYGIGDFAAGARVAWAPSIHSEVGLSFTELLSRGQVARQDVGLDTRWRPLRTLTLAGAAIVSLADLRLAEVDLGPRYQPIEDLELRAVYRRTAPELFLSRTSIFTVFADTARDEAGATVYYQATKRLGVSADGRALIVQGEPGYDVSLAGLYRPYRRPDTAMTLTVRRLQVPFNAFTQARVGARHRLVNGVGLSVDFDFYALDKPINGQHLSFSGSGSLTWNFAHAWSTAATVFAASTPTFESRYEVVAKLIYTFESKRE